MSEKKIRRQDKWGAKAGMISKSYCVHGETAEEFKEACRKRGVSMGPQLTKMMRQFIDETNKESQ